MKTPLSRREIVARLRDKAEERAKAYAEDNTTKYPFIAGCLMSELEMLIDCVLVSKKAAIEHLKRQIQ